MLEHLTQLGLSQESILMTVHIDKKGLMTLPIGKAGDQYDVCPQADGTVLLIPLDKQSLERKMDVEACLQAMKDDPLTLNVSWDELSQQTREA